MDKNTIFGLVLIFGLFIGFSIWQQPSKEELAQQKLKQDSIVKVENQKKLLSDSLAKSTAVAGKADSTRKDSSGLAVNGDTLGMGFFSKSTTGTKEFFTIENDLLKLTFSTLGGRVYSAELKNTKTFDGKPLVLFTGDTNTMGFSFFSNRQLVETQKLYFTPVWKNPKFDGNKKMVVKGTDSLQFALRLYPTSDSVASTNSYIEYLYTIKGNDYMVGMNLNMVNMDSYVDRNTSTLGFFWQTTINKLEKSHDNEKNATTVYFRDTEEVDYLTETKDDSKEITTQVKWISFKQQFFATTLIAKSNFESAKINTKAILDNPDKIKTLTAEFKVPIANSLKNFNFDMAMYFGPTKYKTLAKYNLDLERQIPLGWSFAPMAWINRFAVLPVFNWLENYGWNYGIIILILTILLKIVLFPIAYKTYMSSAKMRVLKPEVEEIAKRYPKSEDAMKKQSATMALYKSAGANPMSGCLPMLLQLPILLALFRFFPSSIELRQQSFLWATDLSTYDSIYDFGFKVPFYGDHVSLFTILMTIATLVYTKINNDMMASTNAQQAKTMKIMMYMMPIMFLGIFNNYAAGLSYYYFLVNVITFLQMWLFRVFIDEKKIHEKIQLNKLKPVKKSGWSQKLENLAKQQQQVKQANNQKKR
ncbi:MAG: membrane protein insertase YidC [Bacteroidota bacterium]